MKRLRGWITARLGRRLAASHLLAILLTMLVIQLALALLVAFVVKGTQPIEGDAGWTARSYALAIGKLMDESQISEIPLILTLVKERALSLPDPDEAGAEVPNYYINTSQDAIDRLTGVSVVDTSGNLLGASGVQIARDQYTSTWDELVQLALSGETNPYKLSRFLSLQDSGLLLGTAAIQRANGEIAGAVIVEMHPSLRLETSPGFLAWLVGFVGILLTTTIIGFPILALASLLAIISGLVVSRLLGRRLKTLEDTAQSMAGGNLSLRVPVNSPDEIGQVGRAFNRMASQLETTLQALAAEKRQVENLLENRRQLVGNISHDLRTPIASLSAHLESLSEDPERLEEYLPILNDETKRVSGLLEDLFELSRVDSGQLILELGTVELDQIIRRVADSFKSLAWEKHRIVLEVSIPDPIPLVRADVQRVEQILGNLITNGLRYTPKGGLVSIEAKKLAGEVVEVRVRDTGIGISEEDLPFIFERFFRGDQARTRNKSKDHLGSASGLGLAIVKGLVEAMGGSVSAESKLSEGTCISFRLPLDPQSLPGRVEDAFTDTGMR
jgi:signal transduction histidine kinase